MGSLRADITRLDARLFPDARNDAGKSTLRRQGRKLASNLLDLEITEVVEYGLLQLRTRPVELYQKLLRTLQENSLVCAAKRFVISCIESRFAGLSQ